MKTLQNIRHDLAVTVFNIPFDIRFSSEKHRVKHHDVRADCGLRHICQFLGQLVPGKAKHILPVYHDAAAVCTVDPVQAFEQRAFPDAVIAQNRQALSLRKHKPHIGQDGFGISVVGKADILYFYHLLSAPLRSRIRKSGAPRNEVIAPTGRITGEMISRPKVSAASRTSAPPSAEAGMRNR